MTGSQFEFLREEFPDEFERASWVETHALSSPGQAALHARKCVELALKWVYRNDGSLPQPYGDQLKDYINTPQFKAIAGGRVHRVAKRVQHFGNRAAHESKHLTRLEAVEATSALWQFCLWLAFTYGRATKPDLALTFDPNQLPDGSAGDQMSLKERQALQADLDRTAEENELIRQRLAEQTQTAEELEAEVAELRRQVAEAKRVAEATPIEAHDWSEAETRRYKIDALLAEAGWTNLAPGRDVEVEVHGMPTTGGVGYVDYVLWGADGLPLGIVEAKKTLVDPRGGEQQAKLYADCLEHQTGQRPVIFTSNGYEHHLWDDTRYPARRVQGFYTRDELALLVQRRTSRRPLNSLGINHEIAGRAYQDLAIRSVAEHFEDDKQRKALLVMATGSGKTRTTIALTDLLMRANWVKRVLFLADRTALVNQAVNAFKTHLPDSAPVNLVTEPHEEGRVYVSTYQTMVGKIDEYRRDGTRRFGVGYFDLVVIDEAHRSVYKKYRGIFDYFDSLLVGLTATPKEDIDKNTYDLFDLETGIPTDAYPLETAIQDGFLVEARGVSVPLKYVREGIKYDDLTPEDQEQWDELDWGDDDEGDPLDAPDQVNAAELNKWLFNKDTVDKVLEYLMTNGIRVAGGDRLGKTIIFAKNQRHADFIKERFDANYPTLDAGNFARVITHNVRYGQSLIDDFANSQKAPHIAISVDMLDTGIDVPEVVNLVLFKTVNSKTKFWQMLGRGTRLSPNLFGPGADKTCFNVFDFCGNLEYFSQPMPPAEPGGNQQSLSEVLFKGRLDLLEVMRDSDEHAASRSDIAAILQGAVVSMNHDNFLVRPHLELVERFEQPEAWNTVTLEDLAALRERVASLPDQLVAEPEEAKRFDVMLLGTQLSLLRAEPFEQQRARIVKVASALEDLGTSIPAVAAQMDLIVQVQTDEWWVDVTYPMLEDVRRRLRSLAHLIEARRRVVLYSDFADTLGEVTEIDLVGAGPGGRSSEFAEFGERVLQFLTDGLAADIVAKVRSGAPLTAADMDELQRTLVASNVGDQDSFAAASAKLGSFGLFIRSLVGLDRAAAKRAFAEFLDDKRYNQNQIRFVNLVIDELCKEGRLPAGRVYAEPYVGLAPHGPEQIFTTDQADRFFEVLATLNLADTGLAS